MSFSKKNLSNTRTCSCRGSGGCSRGCLGGCGRGSRRGCRSGWTHREENTAGHSIVAGNLDLQLFTGQARC